MDRKETLFGFIVKVIVILFVAGFFLFFGASVIIASVPPLIEARNYVPQEVTFTDEEGILQKKDELKTALQKYSKKAGVSIKLIVCYRFKDDGFFSYSVRRDMRPDERYQDPMFFLSDYATQNKLCSDDRTYLLGIVFDSETSEFVNFSGSPGMDSDNYYMLNSSQSPLCYYSYRKTEDGLSPEQALIDTIEENLIAVDLYVPLGRSKYGSRNAKMDIAGAFLMLAFGIVPAVVAVKLIIEKIRSRSPRAYEYEDDPFHDAMEWYKNKTPRSAVLPDKESKDYYSGLFGDGQKDDEGKE